MPHDLFGDVVARRPTRTRFRRVLTVASIVLHAIVISTIVVVQVFAIGPLPLPHRPLIFEELRFVKLIEIPVPPAPREVSSDPTSTVSANVAPTTPPTGIMPETGNENRRGDLPGDAIGVIQGVGDANSVGVIVNTTPPPPSPPPPPPVKPMRVHAGMQAPVKVVNVDPIYPPIAQRAHVEGYVILEAIIDEHGTVKTANILKSIPLLDAAAVDAVRQWRFTPARLNDEAVPVVMTVTVRFTLDR
jgi:protein TonB